MQNSIKWSAPEYRQKERSMDWYWTWGIIAISIIVISLFLHSYIFALLVLVAAFALMTVTTKDSTVFEYEFNEKGLKAGKDFIAYESIESFWIKDGKDDDILLLKTNRFLSPILHIIIDGVDLNMLRDFLLKKIKEKELEETSSKRIMEFLGF